MGTEVALLLLTICISLIFLASQTENEELKKGGYILLIITLLIGFPLVVRDFFDRETTEFIIQGKVSNSNKYYLKDNNGILRVTEIDYLNSSKGDTLIIYKKDINQDLSLFGATILENKKVK